MPTNLIGFFFKFKYKVKKFVCGMLAEIGMNQKKKLIIKVKSAIIHLRIKHMAFTTGPGGNYAKAELVKGIHIRFITEILLKFAFGEKA